MTMPATPSYEVTAAALKELIAKRLAREESDHSYDYEDTREPTLEERAERVVDEMDKSFCPLRFGQKEALFFLILEQLRAVKPQRRKRRDGE